MSVSLVWTRRALRRLDGIGGHIARENPVAAKKVVEQIIVAAQRLKEFPYSGREGRVEGTRELIIPRLPYILAYRVTAASIDLLTIIHMSQEWLEQF
jgi:addiction module RelE/StbE family toxin